MPDRTEPVSIPDGELAADPPLRARSSRAEREYISGEIEARLRALGPVAERIIERRGRNHLDRVFATLKRRERFEDIKGIQRLSTGLRMLAVGKLRRYKPLRDALYALDRLAVAASIVEELAREGVLASLADVLAIFRREGGLAIPLSLDRLDIPVAPPSLPAPNWHLTNTFLGPHYTFHLEKNPPPYVMYGPLIRGIHEMAPDPRTFLSNLATRQLYEGFDARTWLSFGKRAAFSLYLLLLGGLDYMVVLPKWPAEDDADLQRQLYAYLYARNRSAINPERFVVDLVREATATFDRVCEVRADAAIGHAIDQAGLVSATHVESDEHHHFVLPQSGVAFVAQMVKEAVVGHESMRYMPLICGGRAFDPPLPPAVAYIRYNGGDVNFVVMVLNLLDRLLSGKIGKSLLRERGSILDLKRRLLPFRTPIHNEVWTVLRRWQESTEDEYFLKTAFIRRGRAFKEALREDAQAPLRSVPGPAELRLRREVNDHGMMDSALPLIDAMAGSWDTFERVMVAHIGSRRRPWLGHAPNRIGNEVGMNVLRYYYTWRGYRAAFDGL